MAEQKKPETMPALTHLNPQREPAGPISHSPKLDQLFTALSALHGDLATIEKDDEANAGSYSYRYLTLPAFRAKVNPILARLGLSLTQTGAGTSLLTILGHSSGQYIMSSFNLAPIIPEQGVDPQGLGGILSYMQRYMALPALGLAASEDTDAAGSDRGAPPARTSAPLSRPGNRPLAGAMGRVSGTTVTSAVPGTTVKGDPLWTVTFSDSVIAKCFHRNMGDRCEEAARSGLPVVRDIVIGGDRGQYRNLEALDYVTEDSADSSESARIGPGDSESGADSPRESARIDWKNRVVAKSALVSACNARGMSPDWITKVFADYAAFLKVDSLQKAMPANLEELHGEILAGKHDEPGF